MMKNCYKYFNADTGLLIIRVGVGLSFIFLHGGPKFFGGPEVWERIGCGMGNLGIDFAPVFWGFCAAAAEFLGAICLVP